MRTDPLRMSVKKSREGCSLGITAVVARTVSRLAGPLEILSWFALVKGGGAGVGCVCEVLLKN